MIVLFSIKHLTTNSTSSPLVSFLTVNYKQPEVTLQLIQSLQKLTYPNWECVIVNNGDDEPLLEASVKEIANIKYINTGANLGFAGGNNAGLHLCEGSYVYFINNDVVVEEDLIQPLLKCFESNEGIGMISSKILFFDNPTTLQYAGATELNPYTLRNSGIGFGEEDKGQYNHCVPTAFIHGASMIVPMQVIKEVGTMYEDYFLYYEEYDWCQRIKDAGYGVYYCGHALVYHKESISTGVNSPLKIYYLTRNRLLFARRNFSGLKMFISFLYLSLVALPAHVLIKIIKGERALALAMLKGYFWNFNHKAAVSENRN